MRFIIQLGKPPALPGDCSGFDLCGSRVPGYYYELLTLQGAVDVLTRSRPLLYVENDRLDKSQALIEWLWSQNYQLFWHMPRLFNNLARRLEAGSQAAERQQIPSSSIVNADSGRNQNQSRSPGISGHDAPEYHICHIPQKAASE